jgi:thymidylate synthase (FAD)
LLIQLSGAPTDLFPETFQELKGNQKMTSRIVKKPFDGHMYDIMDGCDRWEIPIHVHGLVALVDVMPRMVPVGMKSDCAIVQAARVSTGQGLKTPKEDRGLIRYMSRHRHCYDAETEVLTDNGFVGWPQVRPDMLLGIWDPDVGTLCYERPYEITCQDYSGPMYRVDHLGVDLMVTPEHKMWVSTKKWCNSVQSMVWSQYSLIPVSKLGDRSMIRYSKLAPFISDSWTGAGFPVHTDSQALLELIGCFVGDGCAKGGRANGIEFHFKKERKIEFLHDVTSRVGWSIREFGSYGGRRKFVVYADGIGHSFFNQFYAGDEKRLPAWCLKLDHDDAESVLYGLRQSDGTVKRNTWEYSTKYPVLADQVQLLALHAGLATHISGPSAGMYRVMMLSRMSEPVINQSAVHTSTCDYTGKVYCAHTRTGIMVVRRNGKIVLSGNTTPTEMVRFKFHCRMPIFIARQWIRHRTGSFNEFSARYSVLPDRFYRPARHDLLEQSKTNRQGGTDPVVNDMSADEFYQYLDRAEAMYHDYEKALNSGVAREQARIGLPLSTYTEWFWCVDCHNLFHFLSLRMDPHAQLEIREYANAIFELIEPIVPVAAQAFLDYHFNAVRLSRLEIDAIRTGLPLESDNKREKAEFVAKLKKLGMGGSEVDKPEV